MFRIGIFQLHVAKTLGVRFDTPLCTKRLEVEKLSGVTEKK